MNMILLLILIETSDGWFVFVERSNGRSHVSASFHKKLVFCIKDDQTLYDAFCMKYIDYICCRHIRFFPLLEKVLIFLSVACFSFLLPIFIL